MKHVLHDWLLQSHAWLIPLYLILVALLVIVGAIHMRPGPRTSPARGRRGSSS